MYKPFEPCYKFESIAQCSANELDRIVRVTTAVIRGINLKQITLVDVKKVFTMPDHKAARLLGLTVTSEGMYNSHDLDCGPVTYLIALQVGYTRAATVANMKALRSEAKTRRAAYEVA